MTSYEFFCSLEDFPLSDVMTCFVEEFKNYKYNARILVLKDEPMRFRGSKEHRAFYASLCEFYVNWYHLSRPSWLDKEDYVLDYKYFPFNDSVSEDKTPIEFKKRNIFIGQNDVVLC